MDTVYSCVTTIVGTFSYFTNQIITYPVSHPQTGRIMERRGKKARNVNPPTHLMRDRPHARGMI